MWSEEAIAKLLEQAWGGTRDHDYVHPPAISTPLPELVETVTIVIRLQNQLQDVSFTPQPAISSQ